MAFTVDDFHDLLRLLETHPDWKESLRRVVLSEELLRLPEMVRDLLAIQDRAERERAASSQRLDLFAQRMDALATAQLRTQEQLAGFLQRLDGFTRDVGLLGQRMDAVAAAQERTEHELATLSRSVDNLTKRVDALAVRLDELTQRVDTLTARLDELTQQVDALAERVDSLAQRVDALAAAQERTEHALTALAQRVDSLAERVDALAAAQQRTEVRVGSLVGEVLEIRFRERGASWLGRAGYRRVRVLRDADWVERLDDAVDAGRITEEERADLLLADAVVRARDAEGDVWLTVEVSAVVDARDVARARRRAALMAKLDGRTRAVVAGHTFTSGAELALKEDPRVVRLPLPDPEGEA